MRPTAKEEFQALWRRINPPRLSIRSSSTHPARRQVHPRTSTSISRSPRCTCGSKLARSAMPSKLTTSPAVPGSTSPALQPTRRCHRVPGQMTYSVKSPKNSAHPSYCGGNPQQVTPETFANSGSIRSSSSPRAARLIQRTKATAIVQAPDLRRARRPVRHSDFHREPDQAGPHPRWQQADQASTTTSSLKTQGRARLCHQSSIPVRGCGREAATRILHSDPVGDYNQTPSRSPRERSNISLRRRDQRLKLSESRTRRSNLKFFAALLNE